MKAWTDYPISELGDPSQQLAPLREVEVLAYDQDKYVWVRVEGQITSFKRGYLYSKPARNTEVPCLTHDQVAKAVPLPSFDDDGCLILSTPDALAAEEEALLGARL